MSFHNFSLPEYRCVRLLVKNLGKEMPGSLVRVEMGSWAFVSKESYCSVPAAATRILPRTATNPHFIVCGARSGGRQSALSHRALRFTSHGGDPVASKGPLK